VRLVLIFTSGLFLSILIPRKLKTPCTSNLPRAQLHLSRGGRSSIREGTTAPAIRNGIHNIRNGSTICKKSLDARATFVLSRLTGMPSERFPEWSLFIMITMRGRHCAGHLATCG
jgi:hypothetical protein